MEPGRIGTLHSGAFEDWNTALWSRGGYEHCIMEPARIGTLHSGAYEDRNIALWSRGG